MREEGQRQLPTLGGAREKELVPKPLWKELPKNQCLNSNRVPILRNIMLHFLREGRLGKEEALDITQRAAALLREEPNTLLLESPVTVVGDICGQLYDLAKIFAIGGKISETKYLFLGNYTESSSCGCECLLFLLAAKLAFPDNIFLLRGSHESRFMTHMLGFERECVKKHSKALYKGLMAACDALPLAALVSDKYFCVHGGLSPDISRIQDIQYIHRFREVPTKGAMCDLLWSDPHYDVENPMSPTTTDNNKSGGSNAPSNYYTPGGGVFDLEPTFFSNEQRGCSFLFNFACLKHFVNVNKLLCVIRGNEVQDDGYKLYRAHPNNNYPCMIGVFSAPNACGSFDNKGVILRITKENLNFTQFFCSPHPFELRGLNGITWSLPYLLDNLGAAMDEILKG